MRPSECFGRPPFNSPPPIELDHVEAAIFSRRLRAGPARVKSLPRTLRSRRLLAKTRNSTPGNGGHFALSARSSPVPRKRCGERCAWRGNSSLRQDIRSPDQSSPGSTHGCPVPVGWNIWTRCAGDCDSSWPPMSPGLARGLWRPSTILYGQKRRGWPGHARP